MPKMKWRPAPEELVQLFQKAVSSQLPAAELRKMFGYPAAFVGGNMLGGLHQENMILRLDGSDREKLLKIQGAEPFEPMPGRAMKEYVTVPPAIYEKPAKLNQWLARSFAYVSSLPPKQPKPRKKKAPPRAG